MKRPQAVSRWTMKRRLAAALVLVLGVALVTLVGIPGCTPATDPWEGETGTPRVVVTIAPLYSFVKGVMGKQGSVKCLCTTTGPHHRLADPRDARLLHKADAIFSVGLELDERFTDSLVLVARRKDLPYVKLGEKLPKEMLRELTHDEDEHDAKHKHAAGHHHEHGSEDPHVWLGVPEAIAMVEVIRKELVGMDEAHKDDYNKNAEKYTAALKKLQADGLAMLKDKKVKRIVSFHDALGYFARTFDLNIAGVIEQGPGDEPTPGRLAELVKLCQKKGRADRRHRGRAAIPENHLGGGRPERAEEPWDRDRPGDGGPAGDGGANGIEERGSGLVRGADAQERESPGERSEMTPLLATIRGLKVHLGGQAILRGVDADLERGRITALIGLNGAGKTTLLRALIKEVPYSGEVRFLCGHDHSKPNPQHIGYVPQKLRLDANLPLTVLDLFALSLRRLPVFLGMGRKFRRE